MACLSIGLSLDDFKSLQISTLFSLLQAKSKINQKYNNESEVEGIKEATQSDIDSFFS